MNAKMAKALRRASGYRNRTKTPTALPFPGITMRGYGAPVTDKQGRPVIDPKTGKQKQEVIPVTLPAYVEPGSKREAYKALKRLTRNPKFLADLRAAADGVENDITAIVRAA